MILGIAGQRGHGKDTLANLIVEQGGAGVIKVTAFARALKNLCMHVFGLSAWNVYDTAGKEAAFGPVMLDNYVEMLSRCTGLTILKRGLVANSGREILQLVGTEYVRSVDPNYWVQTTMSACDERTIISDVRFDNEAQVVKAAGGYVVRVIRDGHGGDEAHASEQITRLADVTHHFAEGDFEGMTAVARRLAEMMIGGVR